jgi:hypothetical protein
MEPERDPGRYSASGGGCEDDHHRGCSSLSRCRRSAAQLGAICWPRCSRSALSPACAAPVSYGSGLAKSFFSASSISARAEALAAAFSCWISR